MGPWLKDRAPLIGYERSAWDWARRQGFDLVADDDGEFFLIVPDGRVLFDYGVVVTPGRRLLSDICPQLSSPPWLHAAFKTPRLPPLRRIPGRLAVLSSTAHQRYFHWMFDILPRLELAVRCGATPDWWLANTEFTFQAETLAALGLDPLTIISPASDTHFVADELIVPSIPGTVGIPTLRSCAFLRARLFPDILSSEPTRLIYVSRGDALSRRVTNEEELLELLEPMGFERVTLEGLSVRRQAEIFSQARMVVGPHGAGLTNVVFCSSGSTLVEFMPDSYFHPCFETLAQLRSMTYRRILGRSVGKPTHDQFVDPSELVGEIRSLII